MASNGDQRVNPQNQMSAPPPEFIQQAKQQAANREYKNTIDDVATSIEVAAQSVEELAHYAADYARRLREGKQMFVQTVQQMAGKIAK